MEEAPKKKTSKTEDLIPGLIGFVVIIVLVVLGVHFVGGFFSIGGKTKTVPTDTDTEISLGVAQDECHQAISEKLGVGLVFAKEQTDADHNGKGPDIVISGTVAQDGSQYVFSCSGIITPKTDDAKAVSLGALEKVSD